jgi:hypothetical protein
MLTRRHLFRTLSAVALAPLAKWLPKEGAYTKLYGESEMPGMVYFSRIQDSSDWDYDTTRVFVESYNQLPATQEEA